MDCVAPHIKGGRRNPSVPSRCGSLPLLLLTCALLMTSSHSEGPRRQGGDVYYYLYFDTNRDGGLNPNECGVGNDADHVWIINKLEPSTTALQNLDGDEGCQRVAETMQNVTQKDAAGTSVSNSTPPNDVVWVFFCDDDDVTPKTVSFAPICETTPPDYSYTYPDDWTSTNTSCQARTEVETCTPRGSCQYCTNQRQPATQTHCNGVQGPPADLVLRGDTCGNSELNGVWTYQGTTADGKRYFKHLTWYLFSSIGCGGAVNKWHISVDKPSTSALQDLARPRRGRNLSHLRVDRQPRHFRFCNPTSIYAVVLLLR